MFCVRSRVNRNDIIEIIKQKVTMQKVNFSIEVIELKMYLFIFQSSP